MDEMERTIVKMRKGRAFCIDEVRVDMLTVANKVENRMVSQNVQNHLAGAVTEIKKMLCFSRRKGIEKDVISPGE